MATRTETFEGFYNHYAGWEFDMPVVMIKPRYYFGIGGNTGKIDSIIEDYIIDEDVGTKPEPRVLGEAEARERKACHAIFRRVRRDPRRRRGATYWKRVVRWDTETLAQDVLEEVNCGDDTGD